jgi:hypothetical protein
MDFLKLSVVRSSKIMDFLKLSVVRSSKIFDIPGFPPVDPRRRYADLGAYRPRGASEESSRRTEFFSSSPAFALPTGEFYKAFAGYFFAPSGIVTLCDF